MKSPLIFCTITMFLLSACATSESESKPQDEAVSINAKFMDPNLKAKDWEERWEVESREIYASRGEIVAAFGIKPGDEVADIGSGTGLFVGPFSKAVGEFGQVYAVDISPGFVKHLNERIEKEGLDNVQVQLCSENSVDLPDAAVEYAFICDTYHHFEYQAETMASLHRAMRPGGQLVVIDFERIEGKSRPWVLGHLRAGKEVFRAEIEKAGFRFLEEVEIAGFKENYFLRFERP